MILLHSNRSTCGVHRSQPVRASGHCLKVHHNDLQLTVRQKGKRVRYVIDRMTMSDVPRVIEIERLAYPSTWPPSAYRKELQDNRWAHYIVLRDKHITEERLAAVQQEQERPRRSRLFPLSLLPSRPTVTVPSPDLAS